MSLPKQVRDQAAQVERMMEQIKDGNTPAAAEQNGQQSAQHFEQQNDGQNDQQNAGHSAQQNVEQNAQQNVGQNDQQTATPQSNETALSWEERAKKAEARYQVLQGKYNKEIVEVRNAGNDGEIATLRQQVADLQGTITELRQQPAPLPVPANDADLDQLRDDYGSELIDGLRAAILKEMQGQVQQVQQSVQQDVSTTKRSLLEQKLSSRGVNFEQVNSDPLFHDWLSKFDPETGIQRQQALQATFNAGQLDATAAMFMEYAGVSSKQQPHAQTPFESHVQQPSSAPIQQAPQARPQYTNTQIAQFYDDWRKGKYTPEEAERIEREIFNSNK